METTAQRRRRVQWALAMTDGTPIEAGIHERGLLNSYVDGLLTLDHVLHPLERNAEPGRLSQWLDESPGPV